jgi:quinol-cytochrome oxidoreductase complex cytochrome b subunit
MKNRIIQWMDRRFPLTNFVKSELTGYPTPRNLSYWWNFGFLAGFVLMLQMVTGIFLAMHYKADVALSFDSIQHIMRDVNYGWLLRFMHATGASAFFLVIYIHMARTFYYGSYRAPRELMWWTGQGLLLLLMATAFMGYLLPWGQMSFWGATVITNLFRATPFIGEQVVIWLRGDYTVGAALSVPVPDHRCGGGASYRAAYRQEQQPERHRPGGQGQHSFSSLFHEQGFIRAGHIFDCV